MNQKAFEIYEKAVFDEYTNVPSKMDDYLKDYLISHNIDYTSSDKVSLMNQILNVLKTEYTYTLKPKQMDSEKDVILFFLLESKEGYCQHFASAATLLFRECGIPARYTQGYMVDGSGEVEILSKNAHAWVEIYDINKGWQPIEATPGGGVAGGNSYNAGSGDSGGGSGGSGGGSSSSDGSSGSGESGVSQVVPNDYQVPENSTQNKAISDSEQNVEKKEETKESNKEETEEETKKEIKEEEKEKTKEEKEKVAPEINNDSILIVVLIIILIFISGGLGYYFYRKRKGKKESVLIEKIYKCYDLLVKYNYIDDTIRDVMYRIRYSNNKETQEDYKLFLSYKQNLIQDIRDRNKLREKISARLFDHLDVFGKE